MALRLVEILVPTDRADDVREVMEEAQLGGPWHTSVNEGRILVRILLEADQTGPIVDRFEKRFGGGEHFQLVILPVEAALPREKEPPKSADIEVESEQRRPSSDAEARRRPRERRRRDHALVGGTLRR